MDLEVRLMVRGMSDVLSQVRDAGVAMCDADTSDIHSLPIDSDSSPSLTIGAFARMASEPVGPTIQV
jgi:hypothetical protein